MLQSHLKQDKFHVNFAAMCVLNYWLREFFVSAFANRFELRCESKQLMLLMTKGPGDEVGYVLRNLPLLPGLTLSRMISLQEEPMFGMIGALLHVVLAMFIGLST